MCMKERTLLCAEMLFCDFFTCSVAYLFIFLFVCKLSWGFKLFSLKFQVLAVKIFRRCVYIYIYSIYIYIYNFLNLIFVYFFS